ncbi:peritrophin-1-like [Arctopsyche grandis]|uniref:peritrophin-1-like n=1 Tax=Arctopsyche grandis TaxID=121162 RepID=UPI00406D6D67
MKGLAVFLLVASLGAVLAASLNEGNKALPVCPPYDPEGFVVIFPNTDDCTTFYICDDQDRPILKKCQLGLWFNPAESVCDFPENVEVGVCKPPSSH